MDIRKSDIVCSLAGRDKGNVYCVIDVSGTSVLVADGKGRKLDRLKSKNPKHLARVGAVSEAFSKKLELGEPVSDSELRHEVHDALLVNRNGEEGGM